MISHNDHIVEGSNKMSAYQSYLAEHLDNSISHGDYILEGVESVKAYTEYLKENAQNTISYVDFVVNKINEGVINETVKDVEVKPVLNENDNSFDKNSITSKLNELIESAKVNADKKIK